MGTKNQGQGHETTFKQILARAARPRSRATSATSTATPTGWPSAWARMGSRSTVIGGTALWMAADKVIAKGKKIAAHLLEAAEADIAFADGRFAVAGTDRGGRRSRRWRAPPSSPRQLPPGRRAGPLRDAARSSPKQRHLAQRLPRVRGRDRSRHRRRRRSSRYAVVDDVGTVINPLTLKGQIHGGVAQGVGQALMEQVVYDRESGQLLTASFMDYAMPRADDVLRHARSSSNPVPDQAQPAGRQGRGRGRHRRRAARGDERGDGRAGAARRPRLRHAGHQRARLARHPGRAAPRSTRPQEAIRAADARRRGARPAVPRGAHPERLAADAGQRRPAARGSTTS